MKIHSFIKDTKAMANNEKEAIAKRMITINKKQCEDETDGTKETPVKVRQKKKKAGI